VSDDVVSRAREALDRNPCLCGDPECNRPNPRDLQRLIPELIAEVQRLRRLDDERRNRDGDCVCDRGPESDGPEENCPWHGRPYLYWVDGCASKASEAEKLREQRDIARAAVSGF
jgi:hypothetical protein